MGSKVFKKFFIFSVAIICAMFLKVLIMDISYATFKIEPVKTSTDSTTIKVPFKVTKSLKYKVVKIDENSSATKPEFGKQDLDDMVDSYIKSNSCTTLNFNIYELGKDRASIFLNCGNPKTIIYDYNQKEEITFESIMTKYPEFIEKSKDLLKLKYPTFHVDDIDFNKSSYNIKENEIVGYYSSKEYGPLTYTINYNEIKDFMDFNVKYDSYYENEVYTLDPNKKTIAFSYDDGPSNYDIKLIELLQNSHSRATFFMVGNRMNSFPKVIDLISSSGMEPGSHSYDHKSLAKLSSDKIREEMNKTNEIYKSMTGQSLNIMRPPYGAKNQNVLNTVDVPIIIWSIDTLDWKTRNADAVYNEIMKNAKDGEIVLMHSLYPTTVEATDRAIKSLYKQGYQIVTISELAALKGKTLEAHKAYVSIK